MDTPFTFRRIALAALLAVGVPASAGAQAIPPALDACLAVAMPSPDAIFAAPRKIYAHFFNRFVLSFGNKPDDQDYYATQYFNPHGENDKWLAQGGFLRSRPPVVPVQEAAAYQTANLEREVRLALARGISGFTFDILGLGDLDPGGKLDLLLAAAQRVDPRFVIIPMPDMSALGHDTGKVLQAVAALDGRQGLLRDADGRLVIAPFLSEAVTPEAWRALVAQAAADRHPVSLRPTFLSLQDRYAAAYAPVSDGFGTFGTALPAQGQGIVNETGAAHALGKPFMAGIAPQSYRPKDYIYWEAQGSRAYRASWDGAIAAGADAVQLTTWNDYSESSQIEPYIGTDNAPGIGFYDLTGYYAAWYLTGARPAVARDALYYFYRRESVTAASPAAGKPTGPAKGTPPGVDLIELTGILSAPGNLSIRVGGKTYRQHVGAGLQTITVPLAAGAPHFALSRAGHDIIAFDGDVTIAGPGGLPSGYADMTYWSGAATATARCNAASEDLR